jgi:hypothetical protein
MQEARRHHRVLRSERPTRLLARSSPVCAAGPSIAAAGVMASLAAWLPVPRASASDRKLLCTSE